MFKWLFGKNKFEPTGKEIYIDSQTRSRLSNSTVRTLENGAVTYISPYGLPCRFIPYKKILPLKEIYLDAPDVSDILYKIDIQYDHWDKKEATKTLKLGGIEFYIGIHSQQIYSIFFRKGREKDVIQLVKYAYETDEEQRERYLRIVKLLLRKHLTHLTSS